MNCVIYQSPIGPIRILTEDSCIVGLFLQSQKCDGFSTPFINHPDTANQLAIAWLDSYFNGLRPDIHQLPLRPAGTVFQQRVWDLLLQIPYGQTVTYGQLAKQLGGTMSAQAVGQAVGKNPISIIIPCHRVMGVKNRLTGYAGGVAYKARLLEHEGIDTAAFVYPKKFRGK